MYLVIHNVQFVLLRALTVTRRPPLVHAGKTHHVCMHAVCALQFYLQQHSNGFVSFFFNLLPNIHIVAKCCKKKICNLPCIVMHKKTPKNR